MTCALLARDGELATRKPGGCLPKASILASRSKSRAQLSRLLPVNGEHWKASRHQRHAHYVLKRLEADVFPEIGNLPLQDLQASAFRNAVL
jgi:hypothetical protein